MKKFTLILIGAFFASMFVFAQQKQMSLKLNNVTIKEALETLKTTGGYSYWFDAKDLDINKKISINVVNKSIDEVLILLFKGQKVDYKIRYRRLSLPTLTNYITFVGWKKENNF